MQIRVHPCPSAASFLLAAVTLTVAASILRAEPVDFSRQVLPILSDNCFKCHGPDPKHREADLRLDDEKAAKKEHDGHAAIVPGKSGESLILQRILSSDPDEVMPPPNTQKKLTAEQKALLKQWIDEGAKWGKHWSLEPVKRPSVPSHSFAAQARQPIDAFLFARLATEKLTPSPEATREALLRRVTLDLTGLPPTLEEIDAFLADESPDAYERVVERLLASPRFGERMAWDWLDAARYADSNGYQGDGERTMWPWRDWVVEAMNRNLPYDQFTLWQLAGDQLEGATQEQKLATGFCRNHMINGEGGRIAEENRIDYVMDMAETTGTVWLGLTFNCCRCHDHKFDQLSNKDYYSLFAFFNQTPVDGGGGNPQQPPVIEFPTPELVRRQAELEGAIKPAADAIDAREKELFPRSEGQTADQSEAAAKLPDSIKTILKQAAKDRGRTNLSNLEKHFEKEQAEYAALVAKLRVAMENRESHDRTIPRVMVMQDQPNFRKSFMLEKGLYNKPKEEVTAATPAALPPMLPLPEGAKMNRLALAKWLVAKENPLAARVTVNRLWQQLFGIGIVKTPEDFGVQGEFPKHPELLDWLAAELVDSGWDLKHLIRLMVTSAAYRQSSKVTKDLAERDPENRLLARGPRYRMPSWMLRDQALAASGLLSAKIGGTPAKPYQPAGVWEDATFGGKRYDQDHGEALYRRTLYTFWRRIVGPSIIFDNAARQVCTVKVFRTNTPLHALATLNDITYVEASRALAERVLAVGDRSTDERITEIVRRLLARKPTAEELALLKDHLARWQTRLAQDPELAKKLLKVGESSRNDSINANDHAAYTGLVNLVMNLDEALCKE